MSVSPSPVLPSPEETSACVTRVLAGDEEAARALFQRLYPLVRRLVRANLPQRVPEEDLCQTVFLRIFSRLHQYTAQAPLEHWVSRITVNTCIKALRAEKIRPELRWADLSEEHQAVVEQLAATPAGSLPSDTIAARDLLGQLLSHLEPRERLALNLLYQQGYSLQEVAQATGSTPGLVKIRVFRARQKLRKHLQRLLQLPRSSPCPQLLPTVSCVAC